MRKEPRMNLRCLSVVVIGLLSLAASSWAVAQEESSRTPVLDHFKVYAVKPQAMQDRVEVQGQFDREKRPVTLVALTYLANPVSKSGEQLVDRNAHLAWYSIRSTAREPKRRVILRNQFGEQELVLGPSVMLAVPTQKMEQGSALPKKLDHFVCYRVLEGKEIAKAVSLDDQLDRQRSVRVNRPLFFCVPVAKMHEDHVFKVLNPRVHLAVYEITPKAYDLRKTLANQFGRREVTLLKSEMLAVPSEKLRWNEVKE